MPSQRLQQAEQLLLAVKMRDETKELVDQVSLGSTRDLMTQLDSDTLKKTFWINIYNAYYQILRQKGYNKPEVYRKRLFRIGGSFIDRI